MGQRDPELTFPLLLRRHREALGLSKAELGRRLGVSSGYIYLLEKGRSSPPTLERVDQLVELLELDDAEADTLRVAAAQGRTGADEARVLRQTGPREVALPGGEDAAVDTVGEPIDLRDCIAVPVRSDAMNPLLCSGQLAIGARGLEPKPGELVIAQFQDGHVEFGQYYPAGDGVLLSRLRPGEGGPSGPIAREEIGDLVPIIGVLFPRARQQLGT